MQRSSTFNNNSNISKPSIAPSSSFNNITSLTASRFDLTNIKEALEEYEEWRQLYHTTNLNFVKRVFNYRLPPSYVASSNNQFKCSELISESVCLVFQC